MFELGFFKDKTVEQLIGILGDLISELEGVEESEAISMARGVAKRALISEIQWIDDLLDK